MSDKIGRRPPNAPNPPAIRSKESTESGARNTGVDTNPGRSASVQDRFERQQTGIPGSQLGSQLQALARHGAQAKIAFTNEDLAYLANTFAALVRQNPKASRAKRAKLFTKVILKGHKKLGKLLEKVPEDEAEEMFASIADSLDGSPVFAQMVDNVTDEANKLNG